MTNNPTIDGVSRGLLANAANYMEGSASAQVNIWCRELRALLDAPVEPFNLDGWGIDHSAGRPVLVHNKCSVIEAEQAYGLLELINAAKDAPAVERQPETIEEFSWTPELNEFYGELSDGGKLANRALCHIRHLQSGLSKHWKVVCDQRAQIDSLQSTIAQLQAHIAELERIAKDFLRLAETPSDLPLGFGADLLNRIRACLDATAALNGERK
jgi:hypothetical protein